MASPKDSKKSGSSGNGGNEYQPILGQKGREIQAYGAMRRIPIGLDEKVRKASCEALNQVLADTIQLKSLYKKSHWQVSGQTFYQLHLLFDKHAEEQEALVDVIAERVQVLGGIATGMPADVARMTKIANPQPGAEEVPVEISELLEGHELICKEARKYAKSADEAGDAGTDDLLISQVLRTNELQAWFIATHLVDEPLTRAGGKSND